MGFDEGSLILVNYTANVKDTGDIVETTIEKEAKARGVHDPVKSYEPQLISVGEGWVLQGFDEALKSSNVGEKISLELSPEKGFGERDSSKVQMIPIKKFGEKAADLRIGSDIEIDNKIGVVRYVGSGRAQIDFNHRLAGKTLVYNAEVTKKLETNDDKIRSLIRRRLPMDDTKLKFELSDSDLKIEIPDEYYLVEGIQIIKRAISTDVFKFVSSIKTLTFAEKFLNPSDETQTSTKNNKPEKSTKKPSKRSTAKSKTKSKPKSSSSKKKSASK